MQAYWAVSFVASATHGSTVDTHFRQVGAHGQADVSITLFYDNVVFFRRQNADPPFGKAGPLKQEIKMYEKKNETIALLHVAVSTRRIKCE